MSEAEPVMLFTVPPVEVITPVSAPLVSVPPASETALIDWEKPPRSTTPLELIVVAEVALKAFTPPPLTVPPLTVVVPV